MENPRGAIIIGAMRARGVVGTFLFALLRSGACVTTRRAVLTHAAAAAAVTQLPPLVAHAAQRGAENAYKTQAFEDEVCTQRTPLGACKDTAKAKSGDAGAQRYEVLTESRVPGFVAEEQSDLVTNLLQKSADNKDANDRLVLEKTIKAGQPGQYGPFASKAPVMRQDGSFDVVSLRRFDQLKDRGKLTKSASGLDVYVKGFDPDAPEPKSKLFGIF